MVTLSSKADADTLRRMVLHFLDEVQEPSARGVVAVAKEDEPLAVLVIAHKHAQKLALAAKVYIETVIAGGPAPNVVEQFPTEEDRPSNPSKN